MRPRSPRRRIVLGGPLYVSADRPLRPQTVFGRHAPLLIDVGAARARYFRMVAPQLPQVDMLGIEVSKKRVEAALARLEADGLTNCRMMHGDVRRLFGPVIAPGQAAAITVLFPDPWPKRRHRHRRLMHDADFVRLLARMLAPGGLLLFKTDAFAYFDGALATLLDEPRLAATDSLEVALPDLAPFRLDVPDTTWYEEKWRAEGRHTYAAAFRRLPLACAP